MMKAILITILCLIAHFGSAQRIVDAKATSWAGGVCCVYGTNYVVQMELHRSSDFTLDKIWLQSRPDPIYGRIQRMNDSIVNIYFEFSENRGDLDFVDNEIELSTVREVNPEFLGEALIVLVNPIKEIRCGVDKFAQMPMIAYP